MAYLFYIKYSAVLDQFDQISNFRQIAYEYKALWSATCKHQSITDLN